MRSGHACSVVSTFRLPAIRLRVSSSGRLLLCRLRMGMNRLDVFDLETEKHVLGFRPYMALGEGHDRLEGFSKTLIVQANWIGDSHILTVNRTGLLVCWDVAQKKAQYEVQVVDAQTIAGNPLSRYTPTGQGANVGLPNKAAAILPTQVAGAAFRISPTGDTAVIRAGDTFVVLDMQTGKPLGRLPAVISPVETGNPNDGADAAKSPLRVSEIAFSPDGTRLAALASDAIGTRSGPTTCNRQSIVSWILKTGTLSDQSADLTPSLETRLLGWTDPLHCLLLVRVEHHGNQGFGRQNVRKYQLLDMIKTRPIWRYEAAPGHKYDPTVLVTVLPDGRVWTAPLRSGDQLEPQLTIRRLPDAAAEYIVGHADMVAEPQPGNHLVSGDTVGLDLTFDGFPEFIDTGRCRTEIESTLLTMFSRAGSFLTVTRRTGYNLRSTTLLQRTQSLSGSRTICRNTLGISRLSAGFA